MEQGWLAKLKQAIKDNQDWAVKNNQGNGDYLGGKEQAFEEVLEMIDDLGIAPEIDRVEAYKNNLVKELGVWRNSVDPNFHNTMLFNCCQALLKMIVSTSSEIELNCLNSDYESPANVTFTGSPIPDRETFPDVAKDSVKVEIRKPHND